LQRQTKTTTTQHVSIEQAFERYYPAVFRYFRYRGADSETANDLASSTFEQQFIVFPIWAEHHLYD
jgi:DNA-directed RNA polymerase specialized sigma24 family protein